MGRKTYDLSACAVKILSVHKGTDFDYNQGRRDYEIIFLHEAERGGWDGLVKTPTSVTISCEQSAGDFLTALCNLLGVPSGGMCGYLVLSESEKSPAGREGDLDTFESIYRLAKDPTNIWRRLGVEIAKEESYTRLEHSHLLSGTYIHFMSPSWAGLTARQAIINARKNEL